MHASEPQPPDWTHPEGIDGVKLVRGAKWNAIEFDRPRPVLSSAPVGGGQVRAERIVNLCVDGPDTRAHCDDPETAFRQLAERHDWQGSLVGMMTGVRASRLGVAREQSDHATWLVLATIGVSNAHRAGEAPIPADGPGTINLIAVTPAGLCTAARAEAVMLITESKCAFLADHDIHSANDRGIATGTGTDAVAVASGPGADVAFTGYHTASGQVLARAVRSALGQSWVLGDGSP